MSFLPPKINYRTFYSLIYVLAFKMKTIVLNYHIQIEVIYINKYTKYYCLWARIDNFENVLQTLWTHSPSIRERLTSVITAVISLLLLWPVVHTHTHTTPVNKLYYKHKSAM